MIVSCLRGQGRWDFQAWDAAGNCTQRQDYYKGIKMAQENICVGILKQLGGNESGLQAGRVWLRSFWVENSLNLTEKEKELVKNKWRGEIATAQTVR